MHERRTLQPVGYDPDWTPIQSRSEFRGGKLAKVDGGVPETLILDSGLRGERAEEL